MVFFVYGIKTRVDGEMISVDASKYSPFMVTHRDFYINGGLELLERCFFCVFDGWLSRDEYDEYILNATSEKEKEYNKIREKFFLELYRDCYLFKNQELEYYDFSDEGEFKELLNEGFDRFGGFTLVSKCYGFLVRVGDDFTDEIYMTNSSLKYKFELMAKECGGYIIN